VIQGPLELLASAFLHASWNAMLKREHRPQGAVLGVLSSALVFAAAAAWVRPGRGFPAVEGLLWTGAAGLFEGLYFLSLAAALSRASYGAVYAIARGGALLMVWPAAALWLNEPFTGRGAAGAILVGLGVAAVALAGHDRASRAGVALAAVCATTIAGYHLCYDRALLAGASPAPIFAVALGVALPLVWAAARLGGEVAPAGNWRDAIRRVAAGAVATASFLLFLDGLSLSGAGAALTLRNTSVVFAQLLAILLGERIPARQWIGAAFVAGGAAVLSWPGPP
jgi:drug/metabolite transporter (DMT)-like permease